MYWKGSSCFQQRYPFNNFSVPIPRNNFCISFPEIVTIFFQFVPKRSKFCADIWTIFSALSFYQINDKVTETWWLVAIISTKFVMIPYLEFFPTKCYKVRGITEVFYLDISRGETNTNFLYLKNEKNKGIFVVLRVICERRLSIMGGWII